MRNSRLRGTEEQWYTGKVGTDEQGSILGTDEQ